MKKTFKTLIAVAALSGTVGANVQAAEVTVNKGDSLWKISKVHNESVEHIMKWNNLSTDLIHPGDVLTVSPEANYLVKDGDTLWDIAKNYGVTLNELMGWNQLHGDLIKPGLNLEIFKSGHNIVKEAAIQQAKPAVQVKAQSTAKAQSTPAVKPAVAPASKPAVTKPAVAQQPKAVQPVSKPAPVEKPDVPAVKPAAPAPAPKPAPAPAPKPAPAPAPKLAPAPAPTQPETSTAKTEAVEGKVITVKATAYTASCEGCSGVTATGINLKQNPNAKIISVDPSVIPLGTKVYVEGYGYAVAGDTGGGIKGNEIDVFISSQDEAVKWGSRQIKVTLLD
ncbi:3D domain-containing protein [Neobacillus terrae]|uniref:3D domain-containing protein n=1 Tax=Neobacillus terrae TaxID=3034837 RepID=UPI0014075AD1|nr:3D domain-containing protein [Neobacillus terrae]NHM29429.1 LysM peptidoglycan-binding domain-containing protein [Neobacillus terrae]